MSIHKKRGKYYAAVYLGTDNGKQLYEWSEGFDNKPDAILKELEMKRNVIENNHLIREKESFVSVMKSWLLLRKKSVSPSTYDQNDYYCYHYILPYFKDFMINKIDSQDVMNFMNSLSVGASAVNKAMNILKQIFDLALLYKYIRYNPCDGIRKPKIKQKKVDTWKQDEIRKFLTSEDVKVSTGYIAYCILFTTGMRPGEVCGLRWCDWFGDYFFPMVGIDKKRRVTDLKNEFAHQKVYINSKLQSQIRLLKLIRKEQCMRCGRKFNNDDFINCFEPDFRPMTPDYLRKSLERLLKKNNLSHISPYGSRHSFGTNMMNNGVNPKKVSESMRHSSVKTTLDRYSHVDDDVKKSVFDDYSEGIM